MIVTKKIRLKPTKEQEQLFRKSAGIARWAYNFFLYMNKENYNNYLIEPEKYKQTLTANDINKYITNELKSTKVPWLKEVGCNVIKQAVKDSYEALNKFFKGQSGYPKFKSKRKSKLSFYVNYETLRKKNGGFRGEKIGFIKTSESLPKIPRNKKYINPRISFDNKYWYLTIGYEIDPIESELTEEVLGIDLGVKTFATISNKDSSIIKDYYNINKSKEVQRLEKKLRREQRKYSRKLEENIESYTGKRKPIFKKPLNECKNLEKQKKKIQLIFRRLANIRQNHIHQTTTEIVKSKPSMIVLENLKVKNMMKNRYLAKLIQNAGLYEFRRQMEYKCTKYNIQLKFVPTFYPSSKTCSNCGYNKKDLELKDRIYICPECGLIIDRDLNAAINLANYNFN